MIMFVLRIFSLICFSFLILSFFSVSVMAESGSITGVLSSSEGGYTITTDEGTAIDITYTSDLSSWVGERVVVSYTGTLQDFTIDSIVLAEGGVEASTEGGTDVLPNTNIFAFFGVPLGILLILIGIFVYRAKYIDIRKYLKPMNEYFEERVIEGLK